MGMKERERFMNNACPSIKFGSRHEIQIFDVIGGMLLMFVYALVLKWANC